MKDIIQDYLDIYSQYPPNALDKVSKKNRHKLLMQWFQDVYSTLPTTMDIISLYRNHPNVTYNILFFEKVIAPLLERAMQENDIELLAFIFEYDANRPATVSSYINHFCTLAHVIYTPLELIHRILDCYPNHEYALEYKYQYLLNGLTYSIHEVPFGILGDDDGIEELFNNLEEFEKTCVLLEIDHSSLIRTCKLYYAAWADYLENRTVYANFEQYLVIHLIDY